MTQQFNTAPIDWDNFDTVTEVLEEFATKSKDSGKLRDANEALGQLLGVTDKPVFQRMTAEQQNLFLSGVIDQYQKGGSNPATMAQKLLEGLRLKTPQLAPATPAPVFGFSPPTPGGGAGGVRPPQQGQQNWQAPAQPQGEQWPPAFVPIDEDK